MIKTEENTEKTEIRREKEKENRNKIELKAEKNNNKTEIRRKKEKGNKNNSRAKRRIKEGKYRQEERQK